MELVIWGASGHAKVVADLFRLTGEFRLAGFLDDLAPHRKGESFCDASILGGADQLENLWQRGVRHGFVAFSNNNARVAAGATLEKHGLRLPCALHPRAILASDVAVGAGTFVAAGAVLNAAATIGRQVIVNTNATVDHDCIVEDGAQISPGANIGGAARIGAFAWIGIGAAVIEKVTIGANTIVGAGAVVIDDLPPNVLAVGVPAKIKEPLSHGD